MPLTPATSITLLLVDDDPSIIQAASRLLSDLGRCRFARSGADALRLLRSEPVDLVLLDAEMPGMGGLELLGLMQASEDLARIPVVLLTSHRDESTEEAAFLAGAVDYIPKPIRARVLRARVSTQLRLKRALGEIVQLSRTDPLTGLANRREVQERIEQELARADRDGSCLSVLMVDVDYFKRFNDHYGHAGGDTALKQVAACLSGSASRTTDLAARWGGEEFLVLLPGTDAAGASAVAEGVHRRLAELGAPHEASPLGRLSVSVGVATRAPAPRKRPGQADTPDAPGPETSEFLVSRADAALYAAKEAGRSRSVVAPAGM